MYKRQAEGRKDDVVTFEQLGVDRLFVDEAHNYKNPVSYTHLDVYKRQAQEQALDEYPMPDEQVSIPDMQEYGYFYDGTVSYTHLDVYKRQLPMTAM